MHEKMPCFISQKRPWPIKFIWNMSQWLVWSTRWEQLNNWASPRILMPKSANHKCLAAFHLEYVNCPTNIYAKNSLNCCESPNVKPNGQCEHKEHFHMNTKYISLSPKWTSLMFMQTFQWSGNYWLKATPSHELPTQQMWHRCLVFLFVSSRKLMQHD